MTNISYAPVLRDRMGNAPLQGASEATMTVVNALQNYPDKGVRLMGVSAAFLIMADESGLSVPDLMSMARNCVNHADGRRPEFAAVGDYIRNEVL